MKKKILFCLIILVLVIILVMVGMLLTVNKNFNQLKNTQILTIDLSEIEDGTYSGSYSKTPVSAEVRVTVKNHAITEIIIVKHDNGKGGAAETITDRIIQSQSLEVDTVTGATFSSLVIIKAVENALTNKAA